MIKRVIGILFTILFISGCNIGAPETSKGNINISVGSISRTVGPTTIPFDKYSIQLNSNSPVEFTTTTHVLNNIDPGTYNIIIKGFNNNKVLAVKTINNFTVDRGNNSLDVDLEYSQIDTGEISIALNWRIDTVDDFTMELKDLRTNPYTVFDLKSDATFNSAGKTLSLTKTMNSTDYLLTVKFLDGSNNLLIYNEVIQVYKNLSSSLSKTFNDNEFNSAPSTPINFVVLQKNYGYKLEWTDIANTELTYKVERKVKNGSNWSSWSTLTDTLNSNTESFADTNVDQTKKYRYRVTAVNNFGTGISNVVTTNDTTPPTVGTIIVDSRETTSVDLSWSAATDNESNQNSLLYNLYYSENQLTPEELEASGTKVFGPEANKLSSTINSLTINKTYYFTVVVEDIKGNKGYYPVLDVNMHSDTEPPTKPNLHTTSYESNYINVAWYGYPGTDDKYTLYYSEDNIDDSLLESNRYKGGVFTPADQNLGERIYTSLTNLYSGTRYKFLLVASDDAGNKSYSDILRVTTKGSSVPRDNNAPQIGTLNIEAIGDLDITINWSQADDSGSTPNSVREDLIYKIYYSEHETIAEDIVNNGYEYRTVIPGTVINNDLSQKIDNLLYGTRYYFTVKVIDEKGNFSLYNVVDAQTTIPDVLPDIRIKEVTPGERAIHVDLDQKITIYFYDELTPESVDNITVYANRVDVDANWNTVTTYERVNGTISYDNNRRAVLFVPDKENPLNDNDGVFMRNTAFKQNSYYQITIENVSSKGGEYISWDFRFKTLDYSVFTSHWKFDNNGLDSSGKGRNINNINADFKSDPNKEGTHSIYLNGNQNASIDDLMLGNAFTVTAWVNMDYPMKESLNTIIANTESSEKSNGFKLCVNKWFNTGLAEGTMVNGFPNERVDKRIVIEVGNGTYGGKFLTDPDFVLPSGWYHLAFIIDQPNKTIKIYFNGEEANLHYVSEDEDTVTPTKAIFDANAWDFKTDGKFFFGSFYNTTNYGFKGHIDDMRAYSRVLTDVEVKQIATQNY